MTDIEAIILFLLLLMTVPDICRRMRRTALIYPAFVLLGLALAPWLDTGLSSMIHDAGKVGFLLLLFEVGVEIKLARAGWLLRPVCYAAGWTALQIPVVLAMGQIAGLNWLHVLMGSAALTGCSVGMAHAAWTTYPGLDRLTHKRILRIMIALELWAILTLVTGSVALKNGGFDEWVALRMIAIASAIFLISYFAPRLVPLVRVILTQTTHWRTHLLVLVVLVVGALGERIGLGGPKTAFFLGLALNRTRHHGIHLERYMAPISQRFLIPVCFVALGSQIDWTQIGSELGGLAFCTAGLLLGWRLVLHKYVMKTGGDQNAFLLFSPNLTMVALAASALLEYAGARDAATWVLLTGLFVTVASVLLLPASEDLQQPSKWRRIVARSDA